MSQISPPIRILLVGAIAFLAAWMLFLRPKPVEAPATDTATTSAPAVAAGGAKATTPVGKAVEAGNNTAAVANQRAEALNGGSTATTPSTATPSQPATSTPTTAKGSKAAASTAKGSKAAASTAKGMPLPVLKAIADHKVLVILFWNSRAADDRVVRREVAQVSRHKGKVFVHVAPISKIARYQQITRGVNVTQSPTVVIVDRRLEADALVGYNDSATIDQAVADALRNKR